MPADAAPDPNPVFRQLPSVDELLRSQVGRVIGESAGMRHAAVLARGAIDEVRNGLDQVPGVDQTKETLFAAAESRLSSAWRTEMLTGTHRVINATGVIIHTNLGRAPLSENARRAIADEAAAYCTLEYDLETGKRGKRGARAEMLLAELTGAESVLIVNNCAAAAFFVLTVFAAGGEVVISRGELVEIGGDFRVPDVLSQSGGALREVGTTNRTKLADYENAINDRTRVILRVHPSNFRIVGFTATPTLARLADLAHKHNILLYEDLGSGALIDLSSLGLADEPVVAASLAAGADVVSFSGDKLLGGPQAGIIAGKGEHIERLRTHPLYRALRVDKLVYAALEATLDAYRRDAAPIEIPTLRMLSLGKAEIAERAAALAEWLNEKSGKKSDLKFELVDGLSAIGGGAAPAAELETKLVAMSHKEISVSRLEQMLRASDPPVIARIVDDRLMFDLRTVLKNDETALSEVLAGMINRFSGQNPA